MTATLILATPDLAESYVEALREGFRRGDRQPRKPGEIRDIEADFDAFFADLTRQPGDVVLPDRQIVPKVPSDIYWLVDGKSFIGEASVRYRLNDFLLKIGGHVGYGIRPSFQRKGFGALILRLALDVLRDRGIEQALVTCYDHNIASARVIEANGGVLENVIDDPRGGGKSRRYWIDLEKA